MSWWCLCHYAMSLMSFCIIVCHWDPRRRQHKSWKVQKTRSVDWFLSLPARFSVCTTSEYVIKLKSLAAIGCCDHGIAAILHAPIFFFSPPFNILFAFTRSLLEEPTEKSKKNVKIPTVSRVNCHGTIETETRTQPCFPGKALLYKLHLGFAYFCLYAAWHVWKWAAGAECKQVNQAKL